MKIEIFPEFNESLTINLQDLNSSDKCILPWRKSRLLLTLTKEEASQLQDALNDWFGVITTE